MNFGMPISFIPSSSVVKGFGQQEHSICSILQRHPEEDEEDEYSDEEDEYSDE
jgi:hypothetical protein